MDIHGILTELRSERARIDQAISALEAVNSTERRTGGRMPRAAAAQRRRAGMSAAARRKLSRLLKQRWAAGKMKPRTKAEPARANPARRMSPAGRNKIATAQRARWAAWRKKRAKAV